MFLDKCGLAATVPAAAAAAAASSSSSSSSSSSDGTRMLPRVRFRQHRANEMAHYAADCWDAEVSKDRVVVKTVVKSY